LRSGEHILEAEQLVDQQIARLQTEAVPEWELRKAKNLIASAYVDQLHRSLLRAYSIANDAAVFNDPGRLNRYLTRIGAVTAQDVRRVAQQYLRKENQSLIVTLPKKAQEHAP
jgi:zinc protease